MPETYLYWFRDHFDLAHMFSAVHSYGNENDHWVPVFCAEKKPDTDLKATHHRIELLRSRLKIHGGNLVVVFGNVKKQIPSLARVFKVKGVVTEPLLDSNAEMTIGTDFQKKDQLKDIERELISHSIDLFYHYEENKLEVHQSTNIRCLPLLSHIERPIVLI